MTIPVAERVKEPRLPLAQPEVGNSDKLLFSFALLERNKYFNLDGTCQNWASELFDALQKASNITIGEVNAKKFSGKTSPFRIHPHLDVKYPCAKPQSIALERMWQIRISKSKGGIHGFFIDNVFYVVWFDPQHNLYPDENHGGLRKIDPPSTCCKDRDEEIAKLMEENKKLSGNLKAAEDLLKEMAQG